MSTNPADHVRPLVRHSARIIAALEAAAIQLRASAASQPSTREAAEADLRLLLDSIEMASGDIARLRDETTAIVVREGITKGEARALTLLQQELGHLRPQPPPDFADALRHQLAEDKAYGHKVAELKRAERLKAWQPLREYVKLAGIAIALADSLDRTWQHFQVSFRPRPGRPAGRGTTLAQVATAYKRLARKHPRPSRAAVAKQLKVSESTVRRVSPGWPPAGWHFCRF